MQNGESASPTVIKIRHDEDCYYCRSKEEKPEPIDNDLVDDIDENAPGFDGPLENDSGKLGRAIMAEKPAEQTIGGIPVVMAAHHLIPGNAALAKSALKSGGHLWEHGVKDGNIGYNVNAEGNGVWLPGCYALNKNQVAKRNTATGRNDTGWTQLTEDEKQNYALHATLLHRAQFHDRHRDYSEFVATVLDKIARKLKDAETLNCPEAVNAAEQPPGERLPVKVLVPRLNKLSRRLRGMLTNPAPERWRKNIYTSNRYGPGCLDQAARAPVTPKADPDKIVEELGF